MVTLHPEPVTREGKQFVLLPAEEFEAIEEEREQMLDLLAFAEAESESGDQTGIPWEKVKEELGLKI